MNKQKIIIVFAVILCFTLGLFLPAESQAARRRKVPPSISARSAILMDSAGGKVIYGRNIYTKVLPASTTKVMTALIVLEKLSLDDTVEVKKTATLVQPTRINIRPKEKYAVSSLLYAALMQSANDAAVALAEAVAGSEKEFVKLMNARAKELGAQNTKFANCNGLPTKEAQYTTAFDMHLIFKQALKKPFFKEALNYRSKTIYSKEGREIPLKSFNKLLKKGWDTNIYGKTGYTRKARYCFIGYLEDGKRTLIIGVFGCRRRAQDIKMIVTKHGGVKL